MPGTWHAVAVGLKARLATIAPVPAGFAYALQLTSDGLTCTLTVRTIYAGVGTLKAALFAGTRRKVSGVAFTLAARSTLAMAVARVACTTSATNLNASSGGRRRVRHADGIAFGTKVFVYTFNRNAVTAATFSRVILGVAFVTQY